LNLMCDEELETGALQAWPAPTTPAEETNAKRRRVTFGPITTRVYQPGERVVQGDAQSDAQSDDDDGTDDGEDESDKCGGGALLIDPNSEGDIVHGFLLESQLCVAERNQLLNRGARRYAFNARRFLGV
jgi:hypothetical protein